jgi:hypothetical protein
MTSSLFFFSHAMFGKPSKRKATEEPTSDEKGDEGREENEEEEGEERDDEEDDGLEEKGGDPEFTILKAGYRLTIESWENDLDSYNTFTQEGYSKEDIAFLIKFSKLFCRGSKFSNLYEPSASVIKELGQTLIQLIDAEKPNSYHALRDVYEDLEEMVTTALRDENSVEFMEFFSQDLSPHFFGSGDSNFPFFTRVCEKIKVEFIPETIRIRNVSKEFGISS